MIELSEQIRAFVDGAMPPVTLEEVRRPVNDALGNTRFIRPPIRVRVVLLGITLAVAAALIIGTFIIPSGGSFPSAAAAQLRRISLAANIQSVPSLERGQWIRDRANVVFSFGQSSTLGAGSTTGTVQASIETWTNHTSSCAQALFGSVQFASEADRASWIGAGLSTTPLVAQPRGMCALLEGPNVHGGLKVSEGYGLLDVSKFRTDAAGLARDLESGKTGNSSIDRAVSQSTDNPGFQRAVLLLMLPTVGSTPKFWSTLYQAIALMPGVHALGTVTSHSGEVGVGFRAGTRVGDASVIVDPDSGSLLEARNVDYGALYEGIGSGIFWSPESSGSSGSAVAIATNAVIRWFQPVGDPQVVDSAPSFGYPA
jgi:hypothetical protein